MSVVLLIFPNFGSDVVDGAADGIGLDVLFGGELPRNSEVANLDLVAENQDIFRLQVVVDDVLAVQVVECGADLGDHTPDFCLRKGLVGPAHLRD